MSYRSRQELLCAAHKRYVRAGRNEKTLLLTELCKNTGFHRKHVIRALHSFVSKKYYFEKRGRKKTYHEPRFISVLKELRAGCGNVCAELFHDHLSQAVVAYERWHGTLPEDIKELLGRISVSTLKRLLPGAHEVKSGVRRRYARVPAICTQIPLQNSFPAPTQPGCIEIDLVEHNGGNPSGQYLYTLTAIDKVTNWVVRRCIATKSSACVHTALNKLVAIMPYPLNWIDTDNGSEFLNGLVTQWIADKEYRQTRSKKGHKNDNAHVERANCVYVRELIGYARFTSDTALRCINDLYAVDDLYCNYYVPGRKIINKTYDHATGKRTKEYDKAKPPYDRVREYYSSVADNSNMFSEICAAIHRVKEQLNPWELREVRKKHLDRLARLRI